MNDERKLVPFARTGRRPDRARMAEFAATARKLQDERTSAEALITRTLSETPRPQWPFLCERAELRSVGAVERLGREAEARLDREPREALVIAELATSIAGALHADGYPPVMLAQTRAHAWKDLAQALCYLARHDEALAALDRAEALLESFGTLAHDLAIVRFVRATTLQEMNRFEESRKLLAESRAVFNAHGDARRSMLCGIAEGLLLQRMKRFAEAREVYRAVLVVAEEMYDRQSAAIVHNNIGDACIELGDFDAAEDHLAEAGRLLRELDQPLRVAMNELARGRLLIRRGAFEQGLAHLRRIRTEMTAHGLVEEAGISGLEMVEAFLGAGKPAEAESLARDIIREFTAARLNARAISALGYLREAIAARTASVATVEHVRRYIHSLRKRPEREFVAAG